jgi:NADH:ubiquinone oxidoreductase subunit 5 (subunit L)/multisubunit Na+/H+ antiporter MnhA subunit
MTLAIRRTLVATWLLLGVVPLTYFWVFMDRFFRVMMSMKPEEGTPLPSFFLMMACLYFFLYVLWLIHEWPIQIPASRAL